MSEQDLEYKKMAKAQQDYKDSEKASNLYWGMLIVMPLILIGANEATFLVILALFILSVPMIFRKVMYFALSLSPFVFFSLNYGWVGLAVAIIPASIGALASAANYKFVCEKKELESMD
ncbi:MULTISPECIES: hypothetical protein [Sporosarcina]|uniref:Uncharacterized protein n=1 Tax=Sporosarcina newyorkensis 2681 TaxID=1027292 RepID=F9DX77_9BACL|nr:hypothetical protein [Sporosarcina newyorkensis]EGQ21125.1 hypothetical protein HMPREF9372_3408 [Sporosarcina newyorkensis 2681]